MRMQKKRQRLNVCSQEGLKLTYDTHRNQAAGLKNVAHAVPIAGNSCRRIASYFHEVEHAAGQQIEASIVNGKSGY